MVFPADSGEVSEEENLLKVVYSCGPVEGVWDSFDDIRLRIKSEWTALPPTTDAISLSLKAKIVKQMQLRGKLPVFAETKC